jgi:predicted CXXCH cytochrome family protein
MNEPTPSPQKTTRRGGRYWLLGIGVLTAAAAAALAFRHWHGKTDAPREIDPFALTQLPASPYLNTGPEAHYVGSEACRDCHKEATASFRHTGMGHSMAEVDAGSEPPDATFDHPASKRRYQVVRKDGQLWHRELLLTEGPEDVLLTEYPLKYVVGSGRHARTYLVEVDGFLVESPLTWFASRGAWAMSPGYDFPQQVGFQRAASENCLICHAGQVETLGRSSHRIHVGESPVGCERCHGPGSLHLERHSGHPSEPGRGTADYTIVNPAHLPRDLAEAVCQQCHLRPTSLILARGRKLADFRPGLPLQDFQQPYVPGGADSSMTVTGHVEQMHLSRCYQASGTMTCTTCHAPHGEPAPKDRVAFYRAACLGCHKPDSCPVDPARRAREAPGDDCAHCHMPQSPTEITHLAFTHHRIGIPGRAPAGTEPAPSSADELVPFLDLSRLSKVDRQRSLGLAYQEAGDREQDFPRKARYHTRALELMTAARETGLRDGWLDAGLARLRSDTRLGDVLPYAESALDDATLAGQERCNVLFLVAEARYGQHRVEEAAAALRELVELRRHPSDWLLLSDCERSLGHNDAAEKALDMAVRINPRLWQVHEHLAERYRQLGDAERAAWHQKRAVR